MSKRFYCLRIVFAVLCFVGGALADVTADTSTFIDNEGRTVILIRQTPQPISQSVVGTSRSSSQKGTLVETAPNTAEVDSVQIYQYQIDKYRKPGRSKQAVGSVFVAFGASFALVGIAALSGDETGIGVACVAIGSIGLITGLPVILTGNAQIRKANMYEEKQDLYKISHPRSQVSLRATPILDPVKGRGGVLLALNF
jgi:hypothetical protein